MKYLQILNASLWALGASLAICMGVVCLQYLVYLDSEPQLRASLPRLYAVTGAFAALGFAGFVAFMAHRRQWLLRWPAQFLVFLPMLALAFVVVKLRT